MNFSHVNRFRLGGLETAGNPTHPWHVVARARGNHLPAGIARLSPWAPACASPPDPQSPPPQQPMARGLEVASVTGFEWLAAVRTVVEGLLGGDAPPPEFLYETRSHDARGKRQ